MYSFGVVSNGTMLKQSFVNTGQLVQKLKLGQRADKHGKLISLHFSLKERDLFLISFSEV
jgi:hypothetical protein